MTLNNVGGGYTSLGRPQQALKYYQQALPILREAEDKRVEAITLTNIGGVYASLSRPQQAQDSYQQSLLLLQSFYSQISDPSQIATFEQAKGNVYASYAQTLLQLRRQEQALAMLERGRSLGLLRLVHENQ